MFRNFSRHRVSQQNLSHLHVEEMPYLFLLFTVKPFQMNGELSGTIQCRCVSRHATVSYNNLQSVDPVKQRRWSI